MPHSSAMVLALFLNYGQRWARNGFLGLRYERRSIRRALGCICFPRNEAKETCASTQYFLQER